MQDVAGSENAAPVLQRRGAAPREARELTAPMRDGIELFYRAWMPEAPASQAILLFHRGHEHSGRWAETVRGLEIPGVALFAWDARGHGRSPGARGAAPDVATIVRDTDDFVRHISATHGIPVEEMVVLGHSVGAVTLAAWVHDFAPPVRAMVLATPAFTVKLYVPLAIPALRVRHALTHGGSVKSYVKSRMLTHDAAQAAAYQADPLIFRQIAVNVLLDLHDTGRRLVADAAAIHVPSLLISAGSDWVVKVPPQRRFFERLSSKVKRMEHFPGLRHAVFHETERARVVALIRAFVEERLANAAPAPALLDADTRGPTKEEFDRLSGPLNLRFLPARLGIRVGSLLSRGLALGRQCGFDSGATLDYVYENTPRGLTWLGRRIDRGYLDSIGWRGIRVRRANLEKLLARAISETNDERRPVRILDVAAGVGRYVLETMKAAACECSALLRDFDAGNAERARLLAAELGVANVTTMQGDAFDRASLASIRPAPTIVIVSGLYELFPSNDAVMRSLRGVAEALEPGGRLIYTNQPWHPQIEFIAGALRNREGRPWVMRRRTQAEMDALVRSAGFRKERQEIDPWGIFTVSVARKMGA